MLHTQILEPKEFNWKRPSVPLYECSIEQHTEENGVRHYQMPHARYPSVTTVLGTEPKQKVGLYKWRQRVGNAEADRITNAGAKRGRFIHENAEQYLYGNPVKHGDMFEHQLWMQIKRVLDERVNNIFYCEERMYSDDLRVAGTVDLIAEYLNKLCVIDFKSSKAAKDPEYLESYFMQMATYSHMYGERTGKIIKQLVIIMACDNENHAQVYTGKYEDFIHKFKLLRDDYAIQYE